MHLKCGLCAAAREIITAPYPSVVLKSNINHWNCVAPVDIALQSFLRPCWRPESIVPVENVFGSRFCCFLFILVVETNSPRKITGKGLFERQGRQHHTVLGHSVVALMVIGNSCGKVICVQMWKGCFERNPWQTFKTECLWCVNLWNNHCFSCGIVIQTRRMVKKMWRKKSRGKKKKTQSKQRVWFRKKGGMVSSGSVFSVFHTKIHWWWCWIWIWEMMCKEMWCEALMRGQCEVISLALGSVRRQSWAFVSGQWWGS